MNKRTGLPQNLVAEKALLGSLLKGADGYFSIADTVRADCFTLDLHQKMFTAVKDICDAGKHLSLTVLASRLPQEDEEGRSVESYLSVLLHDAADVSPSDFAFEVAETAARRRIILIAETMAKAASKGDKPAIDIAAEAEAAVLDVMQVSVPSRPMRLSSLVGGVVRGAAKAFESDVLPGFSTGIMAIDEILGLILPCDLGFILAAQSDGKSSLAAQFGLHAAKSRPVLLCQLEMSQEQMAARELAAASGISVGKIMEGSFVFEELQRLEDAESELQKPDFWILDEGEITVRQLRSHCLAMQRSAGLGMLIVDQLDKIRTEGRYRDKFERLADVTRDLKVVAKELKIPIIVLAQRTRGSQRRDDPTPHILDADANSIERDADWVLGLWRRSTWLMQNKPDNRAGDSAWADWKSDVANNEALGEVICLKRRRGKAYGHRKLKWSGETTRFSDL